jgi:hypothetical protein
MGYHLIGKRVRVHLYDREGRMIGTAEGRVADFSAAVELGHGRKRDLVWVVEMDYKSPHLEEAGEGWFAVQDVVALDTPMVN